MITIQFKDSKTGKWIMEFEANGYIQEDENKKKVVIEI